MSFEAFLNEPVLAFMVLVLLCVLALFVMFHRVVRNQDELVAALRGERDGLRAELAEANDHLAELVRWQADTNAVLRAMAGEKAPEALEFQVDEEDDLPRGHNITDYIID